jgi:transcriptional regulator with XRE-family HTH domain
MRGRASGLRNENIINVPINQFLLIQIMPKQRTNQKIGQKKIDLGHIGGRVSELRKEFNLTQKELGEILGVTGPSVLAAERTSGPLVMEAILFFAETFQVNPTWIFLKENADIPKFLSQTQKQKSFDLTDADVSLNAPGVIAEKLRMQVMLLDISHYSLPHISQHSLPLISVESLPVVPRFR